MPTGERAARQGDQRSRRLMRPPIREGRFLKLIHLSYGGTPDPESGALVYTGRVGIGVLPVQYEVRATERTTDGVVTAIDLALRAAIAKMPQEVPEILFWPYHITLLSRSRGTSSPVVAQAKIALNGWRATRKVKHADGVTAAAFLLFDAYDHLLYERWREFLRKANMTPDQAFQAMVDAVREDEAEGHA
ncbi:hypothetical protein HY635_01080 [Candidatus Uhrbacteria bacterium]|nr:hypothetical protein [Candidatus Uhrbacteria bacterium]